MASTCDGLEVAMAMAMEQSAATTAIAGYVQPEQLQAHTVRVCSVAPAEGPTTSEIPTYQRDDDGVMHNWRIVLAIPRLLLPTRPSQLLNGVIGDVP